jgi:tRNA acetyltransferase TAN1
MVYDFNLLVSCGWGVSRGAIYESKRILYKMGDEDPKIRRTIAQGILGIKTKLNPREVIAKLREAYSEDRHIMQETLKWVPIDIWTTSDLPSMQKAVQSLAGEIGENETWRMTVEKRRYTLYHIAEIIQNLAAAVPRKVNLEKPDKILRIDIIGKYAGLSILKPNEIFSTAKP